MDLVMNSYMPRQGFWAGPKSEVGQSSWTQLCLCERMPVSASAAA